MWGHHETASSAGCQTNKTSLFVNGSLWVFLPSKCQTKTTSLFVNGSLWVCQRVQCQTKTTICQRVQNIRKWIFPSNAEQKRLYDCQQNMVRTRCNAARRTLFTSTVIASDRTLCSRSTVGYGRRFDGCSTGGIHKRQLLAVIDAAVRFQFHQLSHEAASRAAHWGEKDGTKKNSVQDSSLFGYGYTRSILVRRCTIAAGCPRHSEPVTVKRYDRLRHSVSAKRSSSDAAARSPPEPP